MSENLIVRINDDDYYLSDIHIENENFKSSFNETSTKRITEIEFFLPNNSLLSLRNVEESDIEAKLSTIEVDNDGDLVLNRRGNNKYSIYVEHQLQTKIKDVGLQLWRASFYLSDFLINNSTEFLKNKVVVDLGAGLGVTSFISSLFAKRVYCTDLEIIIQQAEQNWWRNKKLFEEILTHPSENVYFKKIDWFDHENFLNEDILENLDSKYKLNKQDLEYLKEATVFLAADVIYDDQITLRFLNIIYKLLTYGNNDFEKICFVANEQRINFNTDSLSTSDTAYDFFKECLDELNEYSDNELRLKFSVEKVDCNVMPKFVCNYNRTEYLNIWKIKCSPI